MMIMMMMIMMMLLLLMMMMLMMTTGIMKTMKISKIVVIIMTKVMIHSYLTCM